MAKLNKVINSDESSDEAVDQTDEIPNDDEDYFSRKQHQLENERIERRENEQAAKQYFLDIRKKLPKDTYFVKKGFCLLTHAIPSSR